MAVSWKESGLAGVLALSLLAGCNATGPAPEAAAPAVGKAMPRAQSREDEGDRVSEQRAEAHAHYGAALIHEMNDERAEALEEFTQAASKDPDHEYLALEVTRRLILAKELDKALSLLTNATARASASGRLFAQLGLVYAQLDKTVPAIEADRIAIKKSPLSFTGYRNLFLIYIRNKQYDEAHKVLDQALKQPGTATEFLIELAELYMGLGRQAPTRMEESRTDALAALDRAAQSKPADPDVRLRLADGFNALGQPEKASALYLDLLRQYPDSPIVRTGVRAKLIDIYLRGKDRSRATEQLEVLVRDEPNNALAYYILGSLAYEDKKMDRAADYFKKAILFKPDFEQAYYDLATAQLGLNRGKEAFEALQQAREKFGDNFGVEFLTGIARRMLKEYGEALKAFTAAELIAQTTDRKRLNEFFYFQMASTYERKGDIEQAVKYFEKTLDLAPNFAEALNYLGYMWAERGENLDRARDLIEKALKQEPENAAYLDSLGWVLFKQGRPEEALGHLLKAIELTAEPDPTLFDHLGDIYAALKEPDKAREAWRKSLALEPNEKIQKKLDQPASR